MNATGTTKFFLLLCASLFVFRKKKGGDKNNKLGFINHNYPDCTLESQFITHKQTSLFGSLHSDITLNQELIDHGF